MRQALVEVDDEAVFAGSDNIEAARAAQVGEGEMDAAAPTDAVRAIINKLLAERFAVPLEVVDSQVVVPAGFVVVVGAEPLARNQFASESRDCFSQSRP